MKKLLISLFISLSFLLNVQAEDVSKTYLKLYDEICTHVEENFYNTAFLKQEFPALKASFREKIQQVSTQSEFSRLVNGLLKKLNSSHTYYLSPADYEYYQLASVFSSLPTIKELFANQKVSYPSVGIITQQIENKDFIAVVLAGSVAEKAGLLAGDEIVAVNDQPYTPIASLQKNIGKPVVFTIKRTLQGKPQKFTVTPVAISPKQEMLDAEKASIRVIESEGKKVGYIHIYSYAGKEYHEELKAAISWGALKDADALIIDLRYGLGGASPSYLTIFDTQVPSITATDKHGKRYDYDTQWRKPAVYLVNQSSRSGKEILAFGAKKYKLATVIGEKTAGAVTAGRLFPLSNNDLLYLAIRDSQIDGVRLEGKGVEPDIHVPMEIRYSQGKDIQTEKAVEFLIKTLQARF